MGHRYVFPTNGLNRRSETATQLTSETSPATIGACLASLMSLLLVFSYQPLANIFFIS